MLLNLFIGFTNPAFFLSMNICQPLSRLLEATSIETYFKNLLTKTSFSARTENKKGNSIVLKEEI
jgi:hypothetical protein